MKLASCGSKQGRVFQLFEIQTISAKLFKQFKQFQTIFQNSKSYFSYISIMSKMKWRPLLKTILHSRQKKKAFDKKQNIIIESVVNCCLPITLILMLHSNEKKVRI